jgi:hypothetical protein
VLHVAATDTPVDVGKEIARAADGKLKPGTGSLNPGGRSKQVREVVRLAREHTETAINTLVEIAKDPKAQAMARVHAAKTLLERGHGSPASEMDLEGFANQNVAVTFTFDPSGGNDPSPSGDEIEGELVGEEETA